MRAPFLESLGVRVVALLSIALLPVGLIALYQTSNVLRQADELSRSVLIGFTLSATETQSDLIHEGFAAARVLGGALLPIRRDTDACSDLMEGFIRSHPAYAQASFVQDDGISVCNSRNSPTDLRQSATYRAMREEPRRRLSTVDRGRITGDSVVIIAQPVFDELKYIGHVSLSLPRENVQLDPRFEEERRPVTLLTLNGRGEVMLSPDGLDVGRQELPAYRDLTSFLYRRATSFEATNLRGEPRIYTMVPIIPGVAFAIAVWRPTEENSPSLVSRAALAFPLLMWLVSLVVAYFAVHRLVIRHVRTLRSKMRAFGSGSARFSAYGPGEVSRAPAELRQMEETFDGMVERITRDTAELENGLHEKNVLLKEVHHRVKNNLQLIASIMNMEIRKARSPETRFTLKRVQDRVLGLATVHSNLYHTTRLAALRADSLLDDILGQTLRSALPSEHGVNVDVKVDEVVLYPDQAVPLSLLATEAATNAIKYLGRPVDGSRPWIRVRLDRIDERNVRFSMENSRGEPLDSRDKAPDGTGLGNQLISAFAMQLGSSPRIEESDESYCLSVDIPLRGFAADADEAL